MRKIVCGVASLLAISAELAQADPADAGWVWFGNARFGTISELPSDIFKAEPEPANGDGRTFKTEDGAELRIYGQYNPEADFAAYKNSNFDRLSNGLLKVTYKAAGDAWIAYPKLKGFKSAAKLEGKNWFAYSGFYKDTIIYEKKIEGCGAMHTVYAEYPLSLRRKYDPIIGRISGALRCRTPTWE